jgi:hypothetical protein
MVNKKIKRYYENLIMFRFAETVSFFNIEKGIDELKNISEKELQESFFEIVNILNNINVQRKDLNNKLIEEANIKTLLNKMEEFPKLKEKLQIRIQNKIKELKNDNFKEEYTKKMEMYFRIESSINDFAYNINNKKKIGNYFGYLYLILPTFFFLFKEYIPLNSIGFFLFWGTSLFYLNMNKQKYMENIYWFNNDLKNEYLKIIK